MALFEVPGWTVPTEPVSASKKRKRPKAPPEDDIGAATMNVEKLMRSLSNVLAAESKGPDGKGKAKAVILGEEEEDTPKPKKRKNVGESERKAEASSTSRAHDGQPRPAKKSKGKRASEGELQDTKQPPRQATPDLVPPLPPAFKKNKKDKKKGVPGDGSQSSGKPSTPTPTSKPGMTALQSKMKSSLDGARFRWINEELYKSDSAHAHDMMRKDPKMFDEYHTGFRHQVQSWPTNPVEHYVVHLASYPKKTVIADLGCGDAALAKALTPKDMTVLSFDLVSDGAYVVEADACSKVPLPGSNAADDSEGEGQGQVVDVVVCALSLMGTNWPGTIREAWRILKPGGELKIAEVASRFIDVDAFVSLVARLGFRLATKNTSNTHFTLFEFHKKPKKGTSEKEWRKLLTQGQVLKPCEYKRR